MRIFLTLSPAGNSLVAGNMTWYYNFYEPLVDLGHDVYLLRIDLIEKQLNIPLRSKKFREKFSQILVDTFKTQHAKKPFDIFFSYLLDDHVESSSIDEIRKSGVMAVNFSCNNIHQFYLTEKIASHFDCNLHAEKHAAEKFKAIGANAIWFQMAANPKFYHPLDIERIIDVSFVGSEYARRLYYIWYLLENGVNVHVYGPRWTVTGLKFFRREVARLRDLIRSIITVSPQRRVQLTARIAYRDALARLQAKYGYNLHLPLTDDQMIRKYSESRISLGFMEVYDEHDCSKRPFLHLHLREFEVPMCGALYFTNYSDELTEFYEPDREVVIFRSEYELVDKVKYYLTHPDEAGKIRKAGYQRAIKCHTYHRRFVELFAKLFPYKK